MWNFLFGWLNRPEPRGYSEKEAEKLLLRSGFEIADRRRRETVITRVNDQDHFGFLEADYQVRKNGKNFVVVVKVGEEVFDPNEPVFRRRLIECQWVFSPEGILLLDPAAGCIDLVKFKFPRELNIDRFFSFLVALFILFLIIGIIWVLSIFRLI